MKVINKGGNQYAVTINNITKTIDLDGVTIVSLKDYQLMDNAGIDMELFLTPEDHNVTGEADPFWEAATNHALNYSGFDAKEYIEEQTKVTRYTCASNPHLDYHEQLEKDGWTTRKEGDTGERLIYFTTEAEAQKAIENIEGGYIVEHEFDYFTLKNI